MEFDWDEAKRLTNLDKHDVDLVTAAPHFRELGFE